MSPIDYPNTPAQVSAPPTGSRYALGYIIQLPETVDFPAPKQYHLKFFTDRCPLKVPHRCPVCSVGLNPDGTKTALPVHRAFLVLRLENVQSEFHVLGGQRDLSQRSQWSQTNEVDRLVDESSFVVQNPLIHQQSSIV